MEQVSNKLLDLTQKMYARTHEIYQKTIESNYDPEFDNDVDIESFIRFDMNGEDSVLPMNNDDYYGSNFQEMFFIISLLSHNPWDEYIEECSFSTTPSKHIPDMSEYKDDLNDDQSWYHDSMPAADKLSHLCICHAIYDLNIHKPYSIPDILRMNDFTVEVAVKHQHFANQFGRTNI